MTEKERERLERERERERRERETEREKEIKRLYFAFIGLVGAFLTALMF